MSSDRPDADLMSVGAHCEHPNCGQIDFLPFRCDACSNVYCLEHRSYQDHSCSKASQSHSSVIVCPICAKAIKLEPQQDVHQAFDAHTRLACDPSNYKKVMQPDRCPAPNCKAKLRDVNSFTCKECGAKVCLAHRFPTDHACKGALLTPFARFAALGQVIYPCVSVCGVSTA